MWNNNIKLCGEYARENSTAAACTYAASSSPYQRRQSYWFFFVSVDKRRLYNGVITHYNNNNDNNNITRSRVRRITRPHPRRWVGSYNYYNIIVIVHEFPRWPSRRRISANASPRTCCSVNQLNIMLFATARHTILLCPYYC